MFPELDYLLPDFWWLVHQAIVIKLRECPKPFRAGVCFIKAPAESLGHNRVPPTNQHCHRSMVTAQVFFGGKMLRKNPAHRKNPDMRLSDISEPWIRSEQNDSGNFFWILTSKVRRDTGTKRFAYQIDRSSCSERFKGLAGRVIEGSFAGFARAIRITRVFHDEDIEWGE